MPIARDVSTGSSTSVDKEVLAALRGIKSSTATPVRVSTPSANERAGGGTMSFNPTADISAGRVRDITPNLQNPLPQPKVPELLPPRVESDQGRGRSPGDYDMKIERIEVPFPKKDKILGLIPELGPKNASPKNASPKRFRAPKVTEAMDELGMKAGALTTVPDAVQAGVEARSSGTWSDTPLVGKPTEEPGTRTWEDWSPTTKVQSVDEAIKAGVESRGSGTWADMGEIKEAQAKTEEDVADVEARKSRTRKNALNLGGSQRTTELTSEEYKALSPRRKAAVDVNTLLVTAIREDLKGKQANSDKAGGKEYDAAVAEMFGEKGAESATFAPQTMQVLQNIDFKADGTSFNDVLKLKVGLTEEDIADLGHKRDKLGTSLETPMKARDDLTDALVSSFAKQRKDPQRGAALLDTQRDVLNTREAFNFGSDVNNQLVEQVYEYLANPANKGKMQQTMAVAKQTLSEEHWPMFLAFLDVRSREAIQFDNPLGLNPETDYMRPKRFRSRLGL